MNGPYGTTIFCDDIRDEITGKKTYVGVYTGEMILASDFPVVIPKFALSITYLEPFSDPILPVKIRVFVPSEGGGSDPVVDIDLPPERVNQEEERKRDPLAQYRAHILHFTISPFLVPTEGYVKVRAYVNEQEHRLGSLRIRSATEEERQRLKIQ